MKVVARERIKRNYSFMPKEEIIITLFVILAYVCIVWFGASGVRGSDQYWYVADVQSLIDGRGVQSNNVFPVSVIENVENIPRPFVHNTPNIYLPVLPGKIMGAYHGWIFINIISSLLTSLLIYKIIKRFVNYRYALLSALIYLLLPAVTVASLQPLLEVSIAPLVGLVIYLYLDSKDNFSRWLLLTITATVLILCRESFLPLLILIPIAYLFQQGIKTKYLIRSSVLLLVGLLILTLTKHLFQPNVSVPILRTITNAVPGRTTNMDAYFNLANQPLSFSVLMESLWIKGIYGLKQQFLTLNKEGLLFYLPFNLMIIGSLIPLIKSNKALLRNKVIISTYTLVAIHFLTIVIMQKQYRYMLPTLPALVMTTGLLISNYDVLTKFTKFKFKFTHLVLCFIIVLIPINSVIAYSNFKEGNEAKVNHNILQSFYSAQIGNEDNVMVEATNDYLMQGYLLRPRTVLFFNKSYEPNQYQTLIKKMAIKWLICENNSPVLKLINEPTTEKVQVLPPPYEKYGLYEIVSP